MCMGTPQASGHGSLVRVCVHRPSARVHGDRVSGHGGPLRACVHGLVRACVHGLVRACMHGPVRAYVGTLGASGHGDPVHACMETKWAWGLGASMQDGPRKRAGVGTQCEHACMGPASEWVWGPGASKRAWARCMRAWARCVRACVPCGGVRVWIQQAWTWVCGDLARTTSSSSCVPGSIQYVKK